MTNREARKKEAKEVVAIVLPLVEQVLVKQMTAILEEVADEVIALRKCCCQRGARMQIMRESFREVDWHHACMESPEMEGWFDKDGVPL